MCHTETCPSAGEGPSFSYHNFAMGIGKKSSRKDAKTLCIKDKEICLGIQLSSFTLFRMTRAQRFKKKIAVLKRCHPCLPAAGRNLCPSAGEGPS